MKQNKLLNKVITICIFTLVTCAISGVSGELYLRFFRPQLTFTQAYLQSDKCYKESPYTPFTLIPNAQCRMKEGNGDFDVTATINALGYRGKEKPIGEKNINEKRILVLGDSFAFGYGLPDTETIPFKLEQQLSATRSGITVINAGFSDGYGPDAYYAYLKNTGLTFQPDTVLLFLFPFNDLNDITESVWDHVDERGLPGSVTSKSRVVDHGVFRFRNLDMKYEMPILRESHLFIYIMTILQDNFKLFRTKFPSDGSYRMGCALDPTCIDILLKQEYDVVLKSIKGMYDLTKEKGVKFAVIMIPTDYQIYKDAFPKYMRARPVDPRDPDYIQKRIGKDLSDKGIPYLDLYSTFVDATPSGYPFFSHDAHFNSLGSTEAANAIDNYMLQNNL
jgi:hypothetical protein